MSLIWKKFTKYEDDDGGGGGTPATRAITSFSVRTLETASAVATGGIDLASVGASFSTSGVSVCPADAYLNGWKVTIGPAPGAGKWYRFELRVRGWTNTDTDGTATYVVSSGKISDSETSLDCRDIEDDAIPATFTNTVYPKGVFLPEGALFDMLWYPSDAAVTPFTSITIEYDIRPKDPDSYFFFFTTADEGTFTGVEYQIPFANNTNTSNITATRHNHLMPVAGTFSNWYTYRNGDYNTGGNETNMKLINFTKTKELQSDIGSSNHLVDVVTGPINRLYAKKTGSLLFSDGDAVRYSHEETGTAGTRFMKHGIVFKPTVANEVPHFFASTDTITAAAATYYKFPTEVGVQTAMGWTTTEADRTIPWPYDGDISNVRGTLSAVPGASFTVAIKRVAGGAITLTFDGSATATDLSNTLTVTKGEAVTLEVVSNASIGSVYIESLTFKTTIDTTKDRTVAFSRIALDTVVGAMTDTSFKVSAQLNQNLTSNLVVSTGLTKAAFSAGIVKRSGNVSPTSCSYRTPINTITSILLATYSVTGLTANTQYAYAIETGDVIDLESIRPVKTYVAADTEVGSTVTDSYIWGSCLELDAQPGAAFAEYPPFISMLQESNIKTWLCCGDLTYHNALSTASPQSDSAGIATIMFSMRQASDIQRFISRYNFIHTPSDHDAISSDGNNETAGANLMVPACYSVIRKLGPKYPYPSGSSTFVQGVPQTFKDGKVTLVIMDSQYQRHPEESLGTGLGTAFGDGRTTQYAASGSGNYTTWDQVGWLQTTAVAAKAAGCKLLVVLLGGGKIEGAPTTDTYQGDFRSDWAAICDFLCDPDNDVPETIFLYGDNHNAGFDDGEVTNVFDSSSGQLACFRFAPMRRQQGEGTLSDTWNSTPVSVAVPNLMGYGHLEVTKTVPAIHEYTYTVTAKDEDGTQIGVASVSKDATIKRLLNFAADKSNPAHPGVSGTVSVTMTKTWLGAARFNLTAADGVDIVKNTDYTITEGDQNSHANASNPKINITMLTTTPGTIDLTIADSTPADAGSTIGGTQATHTITVGELALTDPDDLAGLLHWYKADVALTGTTWDDQKGSANLAGTLTVLSEEVNGKDVADFNGTTNIMTTTLPAISLPYSVFVFVRFDSLNQGASDYDFVLGFEESTASNPCNAIGRNRGSDSSDDGFTTVDKNGALRRNSTVITGQTYVMLGLKVNATGSLCEGIIDTVKDLSFASHGGGGDVDGTPVASNFRVGDYTNTAANPLNGQVAEIAIYDRELGDVEINRLYNYFTARWTVINDPDSIPGLLHWWDGDMGISADSGNVNTWTDQKGGLVLDATGSGTKRPTTATQNSLGVVDFAQASSQHIEVAVTTEIAIPYTIATFVSFDTAAQTGDYDFVVTCRDTDSDIFSIHRNRSNEDAGRLACIDKNGTFKRSDVATAPEIPGTQFLMLLTKITATTGLTAAEGVIGEPGTGLTTGIQFTNASNYAGGAAIPSGGKIQVGSENDVATTHLNGQVAAIAIYDHELSVLETEQLYGYWHDRFIP